MRGKRKPRDVSNLPHTHDVLCNADLFWIVANGPKPVIIRHVCNSGYICSNVRQEFDDGTLKEKVVNHLDDGLVLLGTPETH